MTNTNKELMNQVNKELSTGKRKKELKTIRRDAEDPMLASLLKTPYSWNLPGPGTEHANRVGKPKTNWIYETAKTAWDKFEIHKIVDQEIEEGKGKGKNKGRGRGKGKAKGKGTNKDFNYKDEMHMAAIISEARKRTF